MSGFSDMGCRHGARLRCGGRARRQQRNYINLTSNSAGASTNYSVSVTVNDALAPQYPSLFTNPSFSAVGDNMAGGAGADSSYGTIYSYAAAYAQNGNILAHADSVMGTWNFSYDAVDRLMTAQQTAPSPTVTASQKYAGLYGCWTYDSFGNRTLEALSSAACNNNPTPQIKATYNQANNQIQSVSGTTYATFSYDASGNTSTDGINNYWYDAEGQLCAAQRTIGGTVTQYIYDAEGARIGKGTLSSVPATGTLCAPLSVSGSGLTSGQGFTLETRWLVGLGGEQVTEFSEQGPPTPQTENWAHSNIFAGGKLTATYDYNGGNGGIHYELADPLGTKRVQANVSGVVEEHCLSLPFGNDLTNPLSATCIGSDDATEHHFTQKERDAESGNDYFFARYYTSAL
jgi:YD repeat-containing protein